VEPLNSGFRCGIISKMYGRIRDLQFYGLQKKLKFAEGIIITFKILYVFCIIFAVIYID
jgi:hypothetical protein